MSFMRGDLYVWVGSGCPDDCGNDDCTLPEHEVIHLWVREGATQWPLKEPDAYNFDAGVAIQVDLFDELVVMRMAELEADGLVDDARRRAVEHWAGNVGCGCLVEALGEGT